MYGVRSTAYGGDESLLDLWTGALLSQCLLIRHCGQSPRRESSGKGVHKPDREGRHSSDQLPLARESRTSVLHLFVDFVRTPCCRFPDAAVLGNAGAAEALHFDRPSEFPTFDPLAHTRESSDLLTKILELLEARLRDGSTNSDSRRASVRSISVVAQRRSNNLPDEVVRRFAT